MSATNTGRFALSQVPEALTLRAAGTLMATISSRATGRHTTVRLRCARHTPHAARHWPTTPFDEATHLFVDDFDGEHIATYSLHRGTIKWSLHATLADRRSVSMLLRYLAGADHDLLDQAELAVA